MNKVPLKHMLNTLQTKLICHYLQHINIDLSEVHNLEHNDTLNQSNSKRTALHQIIHGELTIGNNRPSKLYPTSTYNDFNLQLTQTIDFPYVKDLNIMLL